MTTKELSTSMTMSVFTSVPSQPIIGINSVKRTVQHVNSYQTYQLTHLSLASLLWDIGKQHSPRWDATECGLLSGAILFAKRNFIEKLNKIIKSLLTTLKMKVDSSN